MRKLLTSLAIAVFSFLPGLADAENINHSALVQAVIQAESNGNSKAKSNKGARGLMQIMPETWRSLTKEPYSKAYNIKINTRVGAKYLRQIEKIIAESGQEPTIERIAAGYNGGPYRLKKNHFLVSRMPPESRAYSEKVRRLYNFYNK
jgi:soluble lytic murein transglycosylase-like protein